MEKENEDIIKQIFTEGRTIKDLSTGIYFKVKGTKLQTTLEFHLEKGGDPEVFRAWSIAQTKDNAS
tara:strand:+ start:97 stop:294 length:198 start_codon:yes stop_codon:yes gene_type:complete